MNNNNRISNQEILWSGILSEDKEIVINHLKILSHTELEYVSDHLRKMITEDGWHSSQKISAAFALDIIEKNNEFE